jgi:hypothetical protein
MAHECLSQLRTLNGISQADVSYTYKVMNLATWAEQPKIQQAFPDIGSTVNGTQTIQTIGLTNNGWEVPGS